MSWIFGVIGQHLPPSSISLFQSLHDQPLLVHSTENLYIAARGVEETCFHGRFSEPASGGWVVSGCGIRRDDHSTHWLTGDGWLSILSRDPADLGGLDGRFVAVRWDNGQVKCYNDLFGMRILHAARVGQGIVFSTRLE